MPFFVECLRAELEPASESVSWRIEIVSQPSGQVKFWRFPGVSFQNNGNFWAISGKFLLIIHFLDRTVPLQKISMPEFALSTLSTKPEGTSTKGRQYTFMSTVKLATTSCSSWAASKVSTCCINVYTRQWKSWGMSHMSPHVSRYTYVSIIVVKFQHHLYV